MRSGVSVVLILQLNIMCTLGMSVQIIFYVDRSQIPMIQYPVLLKQRTVITKQNMINILRLPKLWRKLQIDCEFCVADNLIVFLKLLLIICGNVLQCRRNACKIISILNYEINNIYDR